VVVMRERSERWRKGGFARTRQLARSDFWLRRDAEGTRDDVLRREQRTVNLALEP
jgi:hypothetical protein